MDLPFDLVFTTSALSHTIRMGTICDIDQNSANFSLSDRQLPIRVSIAEESRKNLANLQNLHVPTAYGDAVPLQAVADVEFGAGPTELRRSNQIRRVALGVDLAQGVVNSEAMAKFNALITLKTLTQGVRKND